MAPSMHINDREVLVLYGQLVTPVLLSILLSLPDKKKKKKKYGICWALKVRFNAFLFFLITNMEWVIFCSLLNREILVFLNFMRLNKIEYFDFVITNKFCRNRRFKNTPVHYEQLLVKLMVTIISYSWWHFRVLRWPTVVSLALGPHLWKF